mgnify:CR=1 FL=1
MDSKFVLELMMKFVETKLINEKLQSIEHINLVSGKPINDWEKWLQIEFAIFLFDEDCLADWGREKRYLLDGRKKDRIKSKKTTTVDFWVKRKYQKKSGEILIEFKRARSINGCISKMIKDGSLLRRIKKSNSEVRSFWMVGFHPSENERHNVNNKAYRHEDKLKEGIKWSTIETKQIENTGLSLSIFTLDDE